MRYTKIEAETREAKLERLDEIKEYSRLDWRDGAVTLPDAIAFLVRAEKQRDPGR